MGAEKHSGERNRRPIMSTTLLIVFPSPKLLSPQRGKGPKRITRQTASWRALGGLLSQFKAY